MYCFSFYILKFYIILDKFVGLMFRSISLINPFWGTKPGSTTLAASNRGSRKILAGSAGESPGDTGKTECRKCNGT